MIEVIIAMFITVVAVLAVFSLVSPAWRTAARSDYMGRASGILYEQLMRQEARIMNPCCRVDPATTADDPVTTDNIPVLASGQATAQTGDAEFLVSTTITALAANTWRVTIRVAWPGHTGISESLVVTRQDGFASTPGCAVGGITCQ